RGVDDLADAFAVLLVDLLALGFTHALRDDLLGSLCRDAAELLGFLRELDLHADFGFVAVQLLRFLERNLAGRVGDVLDNLANGVEFDQTGLAVEPRVQVFLGLEYLLRSRHVGVLDRANDDGRVDALVLRHDINHLLQFGRHRIRAAPRTQLRAAPGRLHRSGPGVCVALRRSGPLPDRSPRAGQKSATAARRAPSSRPWPAGRRSGDSPPLRAAGG